MSIIKSKMFIILASIVLVVAVGCGVGIPLISNKVANDNYVALAKDLDAVYLAYQTDAADETIDTQSAYAHIAGQFNEEYGVVTDSVLAKGSVILQKDEGENNACYQFKNNKWVQVNVNISESSSYNHTAKYSPKTTKPGMPNVPEYTYLVYEGYRVYAGS